MKKVGIIMGSDSDLPVVEKAAETLKSLDIPYEMHVYSAHRTPLEARDFALNAADRASARGSPRRARPLIWRARWPPTPYCR